MDGTSGRGARASAHPERGQAVVELALVLPLFFALFMLVFQVGLVARDDVRVAHAARVAVREASVTADLARVQMATSRALPGVTVRVLHRGAVGEPVVVEVTYTAPTDVPIIGALLPDVHLRARATMAVEQ